MALAINLDALTGGFLNSSNTNAGFTLKAAPQTITGGSQVESGLSTRSIINRIQDLVDTNLVNSTQFQFDKVQVPLFNLGKAQQDLSTSLNEQITIRETQRAETNQGLISLQNVIAEVNDRLSSQVSNLGKSVTDASEAAGKSNFLSDLTAGLGVSLPVLAVVGVGLLILTRR